MDPVGDLTVSRTRPPAGTRYGETPEEVMRPGHLACPGCGSSLLARTFLRLAGRRTVMCIPACCYAVVDGPFPYSASGVTVLNCAFETAASTASGVKAGLRARGMDDVLVVAWAGDGGTFDIGLQALSGAADRNDDILYVCYDNEAYMNTGIQRSGATPRGAWTTTTPGGSGGRKKDLGGIMAAHRIPYFATASVGFLDDLERKFARAIATKGFRMIHAISPCPPGWKMEERLSVSAARLAVETNLFPLYEVEDGRRWRVTVRPGKRPAAEYLSLQGRFRGLSEEDVAALERDADETYHELLARSEA